MKNVKKIVYFDMDNVLVNFESGIIVQPPEVLEKYKGHYDDIPGIFSEMLPNEPMIELFNKMVDSGKYDCYVLSTAPWANPTAWIDKLLWVQKYLPNAYKKLILSHNKNLNAGDYLIDDRLANGAGEFNGIHLQYGSNEIDVEYLTKYFEV
jgi:5'(3')-deoxyribonucleotidase